MRPAQEVDRMSWLTYLFTAWLAFAVFGALALYIGYGFAMAALRAEEEGLSPAYVFRIDKLLALPIVLLDGLYNALVLPVLCLDFRLRMSFRRYQYKSVNLWLFELVTERFSRYSEDKNEWRLRRWIALTTAPFLDSKDPKGWHIRKAAP